MKLKRKSKALSWIDESRAKRAPSQAWLQSEEGKAWLKKWREALEYKAECVRRAMEKDSLSDALKEIYPDNRAPAPLTRMP